MRYRKSTFATIVLSGTMVLGVTCAPVMGQVRSQRGYSTRGVSGFNSRSSTTMGMARPSYNRPSNSASINAGGPLSFGSNSYNSGPTFGLGSYAPYLGAYGPYLGAGDMSTWNNQFMQGEGSSLSTETTPGMRPSIRPRLDIDERNVTTSNRVLKGIRDTVAKQIAQCAERPFSPQWYAAHASISPVNTESGNAWSGSSWADAKNWVGLNAEPKSYDFRPDDTGLIFVYRNQENLGRAVDAREPATALARSVKSAAGESPGLSLGVFAEVPPVDQPVKSLLHLVVGQSGSISGYQYDFATDAATPVHGAFDPSSQRVAWQVGNDVTEAGYENLTRDVTRALLFRDDGWTQSWILMRIPESPLAQPDSTTAEKEGAASKSGSQ